MMRESKIFAKEQQIKLIDNILCSLCSLELNSEGRKYIKTMKDKIQKELEYLKSLEEEPPGKPKIQAFKGFDFNLPDSLKAPW